MHFSESKPSSNLEYEEVEEIQDDEETGEDEEEVDEDVDDTSDEDDDEYSEEEEDDIEDASDDDDYVPMVYTNEQGEVVEEKIRYNELAEIYKQYKVSGKLKESENELVNQVMPIIDTIRNSDILQHVLYYKKQGYTDEQIKKGLPKLWSQEQQKPTHTPEFETAEEEMQYHIQRAVENAVKPLEAKLIQAEEKASSSETLVHNDMTFENALNSIGLTSSGLSKTDVAKIQNSLMEFYPDINLRKVKLKQNQANGVVKHALKDTMNTMQSKQASTTKRTSNMSKVPNILPGAGGRKGTVASERPQRKVDGVSLDERERNLNEIFKKLI